MDILVEHDRRVTVKSLYQWETYQNLACGIPTANLNAVIMNSDQEQAQKFFGRETVYLVEPYQEPITLDKRLIDQYLDRYSYLAESAPGRLPAIACVASLSDPRECTALTLLWYQSTYALPIDPQVEAQLLTVPWSQLAESDDF